MLHRPSGQVLRSRDRPVISRDPAVASTRQPYAYTYDSPLNATDPTGLCSFGPIPLPICSLGGALSGALGGGALRGNTASPDLMGGAKGQFAGFGVFSNDRPHGLRSIGSYSSSPFGSDAYPVCGPSGKDDKNADMIFGAYGGAGGSIWASNAETAPRISGPFTNISANFGIGQRVLSVDLARGANGTWVFSYGGPAGVPGFGLGANLSFYQANTTIY